MPRQIVKIVDPSSPAPPDKKTTLYDRNIPGILGSVVGLGYAFNTKRGFWGYVGYSFLGGLMGSTLNQLFKK